MPQCAECDAAAVARGMCSVHYHRWRRANPQVQTRVRVSPNADLLDRLAPHLDWAGDHLLWGGFTAGDVPKFVQSDHGGSRRKVNVRTAILETLGWEPPADGWFPVVSCGESRCVNPEHLRWDNRRGDAAIPSDAIDSIIDCHRAGLCSVAAAARAWGVCRQTVWKAMRRRGYSFRES
jgi:hypothetical protein